MRWLPWLLVVAVAVAGGIVGYRLAQERDAEALARRAAEEELLEKHDLEVELQVRAEDAERRATKAEAAIPELRAAVARARAAAPGARVVEAWQARSGPLVAGGEPREGGSRSGSMPTEEAGEGARVHSDSCPPCLVAPGDRLEIRSAGVTVAYREGSRVPVVAAEAWRLWPEPETRLVADELEVTAAAAAVESSPARALLARWGVGVAALVSSQGLAYGLALAPPPLRLWRVELEVTVGAGVGPGGPQGMATLVSRL